MFVKAFADTPDHAVFAAEADGLTALRELGGVATRSESFWEQFAHALPHPHPSRIHPRFGWHRDNWLGRRRQINTWGEDGFAFFAEHRLLRWPGQPRVEAALDAGWPVRMPIVQLRQHLAAVDRSPPS